jgi:hypothetical protein
VFILVSGRQGMGILVPPPLRTSVCEETAGSSRLRPLGERLAQLGVALPGKLLAVSSDGSGALSEAIPNEVGQAAVFCRATCSLASPEQKSAPYRRLITSASAPSVNFS